MNFSEQPPSKQWVALKYRGEPLAAVWFKPEDKPFVLAFRIPRKSFQLPGLAQRLTIENLLKAVDLTTEEVESWRHGGILHSGRNGSNPDFRQPLPPPPPDFAHLDVYVSLKPTVSAVAPAPRRTPASSSVQPVVADSSPLASSAPAEESAPVEESSPVAESVPRAVAPAESGVAEIPEETWQDLEARWRAIEGMEASVDTLRIRMEGLRADLDASSRKTLTTEEKLHALNSDVARWNKAKSRVLYATPKVRDFIHRANWALGAPERKQLEAVIKEYVQPHIPFPHLDKVREQLENLLKDRQVLSALGVSVYQECEGILSEVQTALTTLQSTAAANARKNANANRGGSKFFKDVRRMSGAD